LATRILFVSCFSKKDFELLGKTAEENAIAMHATMHDSVPPINYDVPETIRLKNKIQQLRQEGLPIYFTQDAGPNLKLLFLQSNAEKVKKQFDQVEILTTEHTKS